MVLASFSPAWFFGYDIVLEACFALVSIAVALFSFSLYRRTGQRLVKYFSIAFTLISVSYMIQTLINYFIFAELSENVSRLVKLQTVSALNNVGMMVHIFLMTLGLSILLYTTLKDKRQRTLWLLVLMPLAAVFFSINTLYVFYAMSSIMLAFMLWHYILNYLENRQPHILLVALAFTFLFFGSFHFLVSVNHHLFYAIGHILELFAYILILINLYLVRR
jgi:hypothetical protein